MNAKTLAVLAVRLIAIYLVAVGITQLPGLATLFAWGRGYPPAPMTAFVLVSLLAPLIVGVLLWPFAPALGRWIAPAEAEGAPSPSSREFVQGAIAVAGLIIVATAIPGITVAAARVIRNSRLVGPTHALYLLADRLLIGLVGLALVVGARRLRTWIFRARELGT